MNIGQLFTIGISGLSLEDEERDFLLKEDIGGVILFSHNYEAPGQLAELCNDIQKCRSDYPLFISVDQEGGRVRRFKTQFSQFPSMLEIASLDSPKTVYEVHQIIARELKACGVNLNYSPVCDILTNENNKVIGDRSFGRSVEEVEKFISASIRGLHAEGVISCAKHFPGHGSTLKDSHYALPYIKTSLEDLKEKELKPFYKASRARVESMMMAHLIVDSIDKEFPTSLSKKAYDLLRQELKFKKIIFTDDMEMKAITDNFGLEESCLLAIKAGADNLIYRSFEQGKSAYLSFKESYKKQKVSKVLIEQKIKRIIDCKKNNLKDYRPSYIPDLSKVFKNQTSRVFIEKLSESLLKT